MKPSNSSSGPDHGSAFDWARETGMVDQVLHEMQAEVARRRKRHRHIAAMAAVLVLIVGVLWTRPWPTAAAGRASNVAVAAAPAPERQVLPDGSVIFLRPGAQVQANFTPAIRGVRLVRGEASFTVAKNAARPFVVTAGEITVRAVGTEFFVRRETANIDVLVTEGCVAVAPVTVAAAAPAGTQATPEAPAALVNAGRRVSVPAGPRERWEVLPVSAAEMDARSAWRAPKLTFARTPLRDVVDAMNRYGAVQLVLDNPALDGVRLSGSIRGDNIDALLELLAADYGIKAVRRGGFEIELRSDPTDARTGSTVPAP